MPVLMRWGPAVLVALEVAYHARAAGDWWSRQADDKQCAAVETAALLQRKFSRPQARSEDYDCDGDGTNDCGEWDPNLGNCKNPSMCGRQWKFGDQRLGSSCRCRRCNGDSVQGTAFGDGELHHPHSFKAKFWGTWRNWADHIDSCAPWIMPQTDEDLQGALAYAKSKGYKVRITGGGGSGGGLVTDGQDKNVFVISLGEYTSSDPLWDFSLREMPNGSKRAAVNAGWTLAHLYAKIRPLGFFLPTHPAGYFFSLGGIVANMVHGGAYNHGFIHKFVTRMRVMQHDGTIRIIDDEAELRYWRCSYGLLGIILGIEFQLEQRTEMQMTTVKRKLEAWSSEELWKFIMEDAEADIASPPHAISGSRESFSGQYFIDYINHELPTAFVYKQKANGSVDEAEEIVTGVPAGVEQHYQDLLDSLTSDDRHGSMKWREFARNAGAPPLRFGNLDIEDLLDGLSDMKILAKIMSANAANQVAANVEQYRQTLNDGFILSHCPAAYVAAYFMDPAKAFEALDYLREVQRASRCSKEFMWSLPGEFRFVKVEDMAALQPVQPGFYVAAEFTSMSALAKNEQAWKKAFKDVEDHWVGKLGAVPHIAKLWGFEENEEGDVEPFAPEVACKVYTAEVKADFESYRQAQDPHDLFLSGLGMKMLKPCP